MAAETKAAKKNGSAAILENLEQIRDNLKDKIEKRLPAYKGEKAHRDEAIDRAQAQLEQVEREIKACKKENP